jgi:hypothetical protein
MNFKITDATGSTPEKIPLIRPVEPVALDYADLKNAAIILRALNNRVRQRIVAVLQENERMSVMEIYAKMDNKAIGGIHEPRHFAKRKSGIRRTRRQGHLLFIER